MQHMFRAPNQWRLAGGKLTTFIQSYSPPHAPKGENRYWQEWEKRVNVAYEPTVVPADNYREKLAAVTASGDLPDLTTVELLNAPDHFRVVQQGAYTDLTPYLTGENLKRFPNLARIPQYGWDNSKVNGKIWGVPSVRFLPDFNMVWRADWAQKLGGQPKNKNDFMELMKAFTQKDPDGNGKADSYGMGSWTPAVFNLDIMQHMFRAPNQWRLAGGKLTHVVETEEFKAAVEYMRKLSEAGIYHPDAGSMTIQQAKDGLAGDKFGGYGDGWTAVITQRDNAQKANRPRSSVEMFIPPGHDGGQGVTYNSSGYFGFAAIPAKVGKDQSRVEELLRICDFNCAPFGAEEFLFVRYGIEGYHYDLKDGAPILNDNGRKDIGALTNFSRRNDVFYYPTAPDDARFMQNTCRDFLAIGIDNPCLTAYSPTWVAKAGELNQLRIDRVSAIVTGRDPLSKLDDYVREWRSRAGDQARKEYEEVLARG
jgi:putative aldouronate transport system substrate-binding protein